MAKNLMIQGTMSGVGKSILTAGLLRIFRQDGFKVAPFKSQNMALNSYVTRQGREIGRAQALQAVAAKIEPSSDMNPILLKPMGDTTSQVIINGLPIGNMKAKDYFARKKEFIPDIMAAYDRLSKKSDIIVIEGAGSPVEINLRKNDIVNMGLAQMLKAPVLLVGDIDPGGVFAQLLGTINLLPEKERERVKGLIINKFRGDVTLLEPGLDMFKAYCDIPFAGIVPYVNLSLDEEDSVSNRLNNQKDVAFSTDHVDYINNGKIDNNSIDIRIAVIRLPYISNYTDFTIFEQVPGVYLYYTDDSQKLVNADLIIIPGTKNTISDLRWLEEKGIANTLKKLAGEDVPIIGICGGFQMLGKQILDPGSYENSGTARGLGLLPIETVFKDYKNLRQITTKVPCLEGFYKLLSNIEITGYEIHMGESLGDNSKESVISNGCVLGTYIHGIFDMPQFTGTLLQILYNKKGLRKTVPTIEKVSVTQDKELDMLADVLRQNLDLEMIYSMM